MYFESIQVEAKGLYKATFDQGLPSDSSHLCDLARKVINLKYNISLEFEYANFK